MNSFLLKGINANFLQKVFFCLFFLFIFRLGIHIPSPFVEVKAFLSRFDKHSSDSLFGMISAISSGVFGSFSLLSLGVMPYILASILVQIVSYVYFEDKETRDKKDNDFFVKLSRIFTLVFALVQSLVLFLRVKDRCTFFYCDFNYLLVYFVAFSSILAGSMVSMWIGEVISEYCIGSGISMIIFTNIGFDFLSSVINIISSSNGIDILKILGIFALIFFMICVIVLCERSSRLVEVRYSSIKSDNSVMKSSFIPLKLNFSGVMPMIFTATILGFSLSLLSTLVGVNNGKFDWIILFMLRNKGFYYGTYFILILSFSMIYKNISFNVEKVAESLRKGCGLIPGTRPGLDTKNYLSDVLSRLTFIGAIYLFIVSFLIDYFQIMFNVNAVISGTSYLIVTVIALELISKYQVELMSYRYNDYEV